MIHTHQLDGCSPAPLAHYLKALAVMRLVSEQADTGARGWWDGDHFKMMTRLSREDLEGFFLYDYKPTPLVSPWNKGAGFFTKHDRALHFVESSTADRFAPFREAVRASRDISADLQKADQAVRAVKAEAKVRGLGRAERDQIRKSEDYKRKLREAEREFKRIKTDLIPRLRLQWRGAHREWLDAAMILTSDKEIKYPALLGTGGNDGRLDFTNNYTHMLSQIYGKNGYPLDSSHAWVSNALWGTPVPRGMVSNSVGQYLPGTGGGANNSNGPSSGSLVNPIDFILMLEGTISLSSHATRRFGSPNSVRIASPFVVHSHGAAYASASPDDENQSTEQWMPLWSSPSTYAELRRLLAEGRVQVGRAMAREPLDMARAVKSLGTARGIRAFQRYGYLERNGQSNLAVPLGRFDVADDKPQHLSCLDDLDEWRRRLLREARGRGAPSRLISAERRLADDLFAVTRMASSPEAWQRILFRLGDVEGLMANGSGFAARPIPPLRPEWVQASYDKTAEFRLALAFALQYSKHKSGRRDGIRRHWIPLDTTSPMPDPRFAMTGTGNKKKLDVRPEVVMRGRRGIDDAIALVERQLVETAQRGERYLSLEPEPGVDAAITDIAALLSCRVDMDRTLALARPLLSLKRKEWRRQHAPRKPSIEAWPDDGWIAVRLCTLPWKFATRRGFKLDIGTDPALVRRLAAGDATSAVELALRRLNAAGVRCTVRAVTVGPSLSRLWAAALAFPISRETAEKFLYRLDPGKNDKEQDV